MKRIIPLSAVLLTATLSACSTSSTSTSSGLTLPNVAEIVGDAKPAALGSSSGLLYRQARNARDVSAFVPCDYTSAANILECLAGNVLADPVPTTGALGEQLFHWLGNFDTALGELETRFTTSTPACASATADTVRLSLLGYTADLQLQCREQDAVSTRAFGVGADGKTYLVNFSNPDSTNAEDIATVAVVSDDGNQVDAWVLINSVDELAADGTPTVQRISANRSGSFNYESRSASGSGNSFQHIVLIGNGTFLNGTGTNGTGTVFTEFCVNPATGATLTGGECDSAAFPTTDLTGDGTVEIPSLSGQEQTTTEAISALVATDLSAVSTVE
jgi:hypothetical protein